MAQRMGGSRRKSRHKLSKNVREHGKISLPAYFQIFTKGDPVFLVADPSIHRGLYHARFHGRAGTVVGPRGKCYEIAIKDVHMHKVLIVHPVHLKKRI